MKLIFVGTAAAFSTDPNNFDSNILLLNPDNRRTLLIDCGCEARRGLHRLGYTYKDISAVYISHLHADHVGGLEWLALSTKYDSKCNKPTLYANDTIALSVWDNVLSAGLRTLNNENATLSTFFKVESVTSNFMWEGIKFQTIQTVHVIAGYHFMPSFGLIFEINGKNIYITTDTQFAPKQLQFYYDSADVIFHDCETSQKESGVHSHFSNLITLSPQTKAKMWLYHYNSCDLPNAVENGFCGFVKPGQLFEF